MSGALTIQPDSSSNVLDSRLQDLESVRQARSAQGDLVIIARKVLLQSPIWFSTRLAAKHALTGWVWDEPRGPRRGISTFNSEPLEGRPGLRKQRLTSGGLLRYIDLDLLLALAYHWQETGESQIDVDQETVLSWIGYPRLEIPPYFELRASVTRIQATQIRVFTELPLQPVEMRILPPLLVEPTSYKEGRRNRLRASLGEGWLSEIRRENQAISLRSYLPLVRCIREADQMARHQRATGLPDAARMVLLFLDSFRTPQNTSVVKLDWIHERYGDRKVSIPDLVREPAASLVNGQLTQADPTINGWTGIPAPPSAQHYRYVNPLHPQGMLHRALDLLGKCQIITGYEALGDRLEVRWQDYARLPMPSIAQRPYRQGKIFKVNKLNGEIAAIDLDKLPLVTAGPEAPPSTPPSLLPAPPTAGLSPEVPLLVTTTAHVPEKATNTSSVTPGKSNDLLWKFIIRQYCPLTASQYQELHQKGWGTKELMRLILTAVFHHEVKSLPNSSDLVKHPTRFILSRLHLDQSDMWSRVGMVRQGFDPSEVQSWAYQPSGFIERMRKRAEILP